MRMDFPEIKNQSKNEFKNPQLITDFTIFRKKKNTDLETNNYPATEKKRQSNALAVKRSVVHERLLEIQVIYVVAWDGEPANQNSENGFRLERIQNKPISPSKACST